MFTRKKVESTDYIEVDISVICCVCFFQEAESRAKRMLCWDVSNGVCIEYKNPS